MSFLTADRLEINDVVSWIADQLDAIRSRSVKRAPQPGGRNQSGGVLGKATKLLGLVQESSNPHRCIDREASVRYALSLQEEVLGLATLAQGKSQRELAQELCAGMRAPLATTFTNAWLDDTHLNEGDDKVEDGKLEWVIGVAAVVIVAVIVVLVRRGQIVKAQQRQWTPSDDFKLIIELSKEASPAGAIAQTTQSSVKEPWSWSLVEGAKRLEEHDRRTLLARLAEWQHSQVESIMPALSTLFDSQTMNTARGLNEDDVWVVTRVLQPGFAHRGRTLELAQVDVATLDSHVLLDKACPVGCILSERADELLPGGSAGIATWRATWGLSNPEDLRELLDEGQLDIWRRRMIKDLNGGYEHNKARQLVLTGQAGAIFEPSTMDVEGSPPVGDAFVTEVVARDGLVQHGLACPGGSPLLLAIVQVNSLEST